MAGEEKKRAVAEKARMPVFQIMARKEFAAEIDKLFVVHLLRSQYQNRSFLRTVSPRICITLFRNIGPSKTKE